MGEASMIKSSAMVQSSKSKTTESSTSSIQVNTENHGNKSSMMKTQDLIPLVAGLAAGGVSTALLFPIDMVKVRLQVHEESGGKTAGLRMGSFRVARGIVRHEGIAGLYQGVTPAVVGAAVSWGGYFFLYEGLKRRVSDYKKNQQQPVDSKPVVFSSGENFVMACVAGAAMVFLTNPIWLIKTRMQLQMNQASMRYTNIKRPYSGMFDAARTIVREEGLLALYKGTLPALMLTSHGGVQFMVYEFLKQYFHFKRAKRTVSDEGHISVLQRLNLSLGYLAMGAVSKMIASTVTYPLQVIKSRIQQRSEAVEVTAEGNVRVVKREYVGFVDTVKRIAGKEGVVGFFRGSLPNAVRVAPGAAVTFVVYEAVMDILAPQ